MNGKLRNMTAIYISRDEEMPVTARYMLAHYLGIGKNTESLYAGATTETGMVFTKLKEF